MTKSEKREIGALETAARFGTDVGYLARGWSALVRSARTTKSRNEILTAAASWPKIVQHPEFITG